MSKEQWDKSFSNKEYVYGIKPNVFVRDKEKLLKRNSKIACFAEGEGRNAVYLAKKGHTVTAYDQSKVGLEKTQNLASKNDIQIATKQIDLTEIRVKEKNFDAAIMTFGHVPKDKQSFFLNNMFESISIGGYMIVEVYSEEQLAYRTGGPPVIENLYDPVQLLEWIQEKKAKCLHFYYGEEIRNEGERHKGLCHLIQFVLQK